MTKTAEITSGQNLLPMGLAEGCVLKRDIAKDQVITYADVTLPERSVPASVDPPPHVAPSSVEDLVRNVNVPRSSRVQDTQRRS